MQQQAQSQIQEPIVEPPFQEEELEEVVTTGVDIGIVKIDYGSVWLDVVAGTALILLVIVGYYWKKKIDNKFK